MHKCRPAETDQELDQLGRGMEREAWGLPSPFSIQSSKPPLGNGRCSPPYGQHSMGQRQWIHAAAEVPDKDG